MARPGGTLTRRGATGPLLVAAATLLAASPWPRAYDVADLWGLLVVAAVAPVVVAAVGRRTGATVAVTTAMSGMALAVVLLALSGGHPAIVLRDLRDGPADLLSETLPLRGGTDLAAVPVVVTWVSAAAGAELAGRAWRSGAALAVAPLSLAATYALTSGAGPLPAAYPAALLAVTASHAAWRHRRLRPPRLGEEAGSSPTWRTGAPAALVVVALAVTAGSVVPHLDGTGSDLSRDVPVLSATLVDPVDSTFARRDGAGPHAPPLGALIVDGSASGYLATAILDRYDGATWSFAARFEPTGGRVPAGPGPLGGVDGVRATVTVSLRPGADGGPLPLPDRPVDVDGGPVDVDAATGLVVAAGPRAASYRVSTRSPAITVAGLPPRARLVTDGSAVGSLPPGAGPDVAAVVASLATATGVPPSATAGFARAVVGVFARLDRRSAPGGQASGAPGGTSLAQVIDATTGVRIASPEQFATMVAVVERYLGVPARVATGYRLPPAAHDGRLGRGRYTFTAADAWTWVEVPVGGVGWVVLDPTPELTTASSPPPPVQVTVAPPSAKPAPTEGLPTAGVGGGHALAPRVALRLRPTVSAGGTPPLLLAGVAGVFLALAVVGAPLLGRSVRRRRRNGGGPGHRSAGAWLEVLDDLGAAGLVVAPSATVAEVTRRATEVFGPPVGGAVAAVGAVAERAVFLPSHRCDVEADEAWRHRRLVTARLADDMGRRRRVAAALRPRRWSS